MSAPGSRRLRRAALLVALAPALGGCVTQFNLRTDTLATPPTQPTVGPGSSLGSGVGVSVQAGNSLGAVLVGAGLAAAVAGGWREAPAIDARRAPEADPTRRIEERDCTQPLQSLVGNLRCR